MPNYPNRFDKPYQENKSLKLPYSMGRTERKLYQQYSFALEQYRDLVNYLNSTSESLDPQTNERKGYGKNEYGFEKEMDPEITALLKEKVSNLLAAGQKLATEINQPDSSTPESRALLFDIRQILQRCNQENSVLENLEEGEQLSYLALHARSNDVILDVGENELDKVGGQVSSRLPLRYMDESGKLRSGYFTADEETGHSYRGIVNQAKEKAPGISAFLDALVKQYVIDPDSMNPNFINLVSFINHLPDKKFSSAEALKSFFIPDDDEYDPDITEEQEQMSELVQKLEISNQELSVLNEMFARLSDKHLGDRQRLDELMHFSEGYSSNQRNTAMSDIATALGIPDIIAKTQPMTIIKNGESVHGCFMANAKGVDFDDILPQNELLGGKTISIDYDRTLTDATNLMVLDYICCNGDRHQNNMFYRFSKDTNGNPVLVGFQGIDNDLSFGNLVPRVTQSVKLLPPVQDIRMMKKDTADHVMALTEDRITGILMGKGLSPEEISACWKRTEMLQNQIQSGTVHITEDPFQKKDWKKMVDQVQGRLNYKKGACDPIYNTILMQNTYNQATFQVQSKGKLSEFTAKKQQADRKKRIEQGLKNLKNKVYIDEKLTIRSQSDQVKKLFSKLKAPKEGDLPEYKAMYEQLSQLNNTLKEYKDSPLSADIKGNILHEMFKESQDAIRSYTAALPDEPDRNNSKRLSVVQSLSSVCTNGIESRERQVNELNTLMSKSFEEVSKAAAAVKSSTDPFEKSIAQLSLDAKVHLSSYVGNVEKPKAADAEAISRSFAAMLVTGKLRSLHAGGDAEAYREQKQEFAQDPDSLNRLVNNMMNHADFKKLISHVNPINAVANNTVSEMSKLAEEMNLFEATGVVKQPELQAPENVLGGR